MPILIQGITALASAAARTSAATRRLAAGTRIRMSESLMKEASEYLQTTRFKSSRKGVHSE